MKCVMPVVRPRRIEAVPARIAGAHQARVVGVSFGEQQHRPVQRRRRSMHFGGQLLEDVLWRIVDDRVHRVQTQAVDVVIANPHQRVVHNEATNLVAAVSVEIERSPPGGPISIGEVRAEIAQVVAHRARVVVDDVEHDAETGGMTVVDQPLETGWTPIGVVRSEEIHTVIPPPAIARELGDWHELDGVDAERDEVGKMVDDAVEGAGRREGPDVQLIKDEASG